jgi:hypothetical protein
MTTTRWRLMPRKMKDAIVRVPSSAQSLLITALPTRNLACRRGEAAGLVPGSRPASFNEIPLRPTQSGSVLGNAVPRKWAMHFVPGTLEPSSRHHRRAANRRQLSAPRSRLTRLAKPNKEPAPAPQVWFTDQLAARTQVRWRNAVRHKLKKPLSIT